MRHRKAGVKLHRTTSHRQAMFRNMVTSLFKHERIRTTDVKAKELRRWADQIITLAKRGDLHARRQVLAIVREKDVVHKLFAEAQERFGNINGGYTRIVKIGQRPGDAAPISLIELVVTEETDKKSKKKSKPAVKKKEAPAATAAPKTAPAEASAPVEAEGAKEAAATETEEATESSAAAAEAAPEESAKAAETEGQAAPEAGEDTEKKE